MKKILKVTLLIFGIIITTFVTIYFLIMKGVIQVNIFPNARTLYEGFVEIESIPLSEIKTRLETHGCTPNSDFSNDRSNNCMYRETEILQLKENGVEIYPQGPGFGPVSFYMTENKVWSWKDLPGSPSPEKFKEKVRQDLENIGSIVKIKENSWKITKMEYPYAVIY